MKIIHLILLIFAHITLASASDNQSEATPEQKKTKITAAKQAYDFDSMFSENKKKHPPKVDSKIDVSQFKKDAEGEYNNVKNDYYHKHEYVPPSQNSSLQNGGNCFFIEHNEDMKNDCLANAKSDYNWCFNINNKDLQYSCLGQVKKDPNQCFSINNKNMMNACLASAKMDSNYCFNVNNKNLQNSCLAQTKHDKSWCFLINNENMKNACLAITEN